MCSSFQHQQLIYERQQAEQQQQMMLQQQQQQLEQQRKQEQRRKEEQQRILEQQQMQQRQEETRQLRRSQTPSLTRRATFEPINQGSNFKKVESHFGQVKTGHVHEKKNFWMRSMSSDKLHQVNSRYKI